jgi:HPt (histidine-containing phosphotransfer) domain-containing protein
MQYIDTTQLVQISRGDKDRMMKYLSQFEELIPQRIESLQERLGEEDRKGVRQILHQMSPQLQFFGVPGVVEPIRRLATEYETIPMEDIKKQVHFIIHQLDHALLDVQRFAKRI